MPHPPVLRKELPPPPQHQTPQQFDSDMPSALFTSDMNHPLPPLPPPSDFSNKLQKNNPAADQPIERKPSPTRPLQQTEELYQSLPNLPMPQRPVSTSVASSGSRPNSAGYSGNESDTYNAKTKKRSSWLPGSRSRSRQTSQEIVDIETKQAWIQQSGGNMEYKTQPLLSGGKVPELWSEESDVFVYLFPRASGHGPSFRIPSHVLSSSETLLKMMESDIYAGGHNRNRSFGGRGTLEAGDASRNFAMRGINTPPITPNMYPADSQTRYDYDTAPYVSPESPPPREVHLFFPTGVMSESQPFKPEEFQKLVAARNLFAFLMQQPLVNTPQCHGFRVFLEVAALLRTFNFSNIDGSSFGEVASASFDNYISDLNLADVRESREKTVEALILAEAMKSTRLYDEAFSHAVGKYDSITSSNFAILSEISQTTKSRLERAFIELKGRQASVSSRLTTFEFPSLFVGIAASKTREESKYVHFKQWINGFSLMRKFVMSYYKELHGEWPPKGNTKKNQFVEGGLNRLVLTMLYKDLCQLYNFLVDRNSMTTRTYGEPNDHADATVDPIHRTLRLLLSEYDRSSPPVQPPIPFDVPLVPQVVTVNPSFPGLEYTKKAKEATRKLKSHETILVLTKSHNLDADIKTNFVQSFKEFEHRYAKGKNSAELADMRYGNWIFLYAVIQALPLLVVDAPGVQYTEGVEYFLCQPPLGSPPWLEGTEMTKNEWYSVQGGNMVSLPSHIVEHSAEAVYRRSHCWTIGSQWIGSDSDGSSMRPSVTDSDFNTLSPLEPPPGLAGGLFGRRPESRGRSRNNGSVDLKNEFSSLDLRNSGPASIDQMTMEKRAARDQKRKSIALGLEKLPIPSGFDDWTPQGPPTGGSEHISLGGSTFSTSAHSQSTSTQFYPSASDTSDPFSPSFSSPMSTSLAPSSKTGSPTTLGGYVPPITVPGSAVGGRGTSRPHSTAPSSGTGHVQNHNTGQTFDDILGSMGVQAVPEVVKPKKLGKKRVD